MSSHLKNLRVITHENTDFTNNKFTQTVTSRTQISHITLREIYRELHQKNEDSKHAKRSRFLASGGHDKYAHPPTLATSNQPSFMKVRTFYQVPAGSFRRQVDFCY